MSDVSFQAKVLLAYNTLDERIESYVYHISKKLKHNSFLLKTSLVEFFSKLEDFGELDYFNILIKEKEMFVEYIKKHSPYIETILVIMEDDHVK